ICSASVSTAYAYVADVTPADERAARFGLVGVAFGAGFVFGPALAGLAATVNRRRPSWIAPPLGSATGPYALLILPESLPLDRRAPFTWQRANPVGSLVLLRSHPGLTTLALVNFLSSLAHASLPTIGVLYMMYRYQWDERMVGFTMAGVGLCAM